MTEANEEGEGEVLRGAPEGRRPWTIKSMPEWAMDLARGAAADARLPMGEWLAGVIAMATHPNGAGGALGAPRTPSGSGGLLATGGRAARGAPPASQARAAAKEDITAAEATEIARQVSTIEGLPRSVLREAHGLLRDKLRAARTRGLAVSQKTVADSGRDAASG